MAWIYLIFAGALEIAWAAALKKLGFRFDWAWALLAVFAMLGSEVRSVASMPGYKDRMIAARDLVDAAHDNDIPVIFIQEIHRPDLVDFGRELDGNEDIHCLDGDPPTDVAKEEMGFLKGDYIVPKRRYSAFFGTDWKSCSSGYGLIH